MERAPVPAPVEVPRFFVCPISLEVMRDPVTLSSGITYDRDSIERWVFTDGHGDCPVTKLPLGAGDLEPTPNHTLRRLIQSWCAAHAVERFPTPRPPVDSDRVSAILLDAAATKCSGEPELLAAKLGELADIVAESDRNRRCVEAAPGAAELLVSVLKTSRDAAAATSPSTLSSASSISPAEEEALSILHSLKLSDETLKRVMDTHDDLVDTLASVLRWPSHRSRTHGMHLLKAALSATQPSRLSSVSTELIEAVVMVASDTTSPPKAVKLALHVLCRLCPWGRNRIRAVEAGAMGTLIELLLNEGCCGGGGSKRAGELAAVAIDHLCGCAEGRQELVAHPAGMAAVARAATRLSPAGTESAVRALHAVARHSATPAVLQEMLAVGVVARLLYLVQAGAAGERPRERAREMLKMHARVWRGSPCLASHVASYPC
ncbi:hypothetical protein HU200_053084 [Digitaria exilis]|uniref:U-box domain-containing protein n=1 Tax=Digitaria exilis TaxID=1010633 RepID=A0A835E6U8_9POAL|nr:hypothetical protein HU200_053084 [Digitaria exilis]